MRQASDRPSRSGGWIHRLTETAGRPRLRGISIPSRIPSRTDLPELAERYRRAVLPHRLDELAHSLGVSAESLTRLGVGWAYDAGRAESLDAGDVLRVPTASMVWSFPMRAGDGSVSGIRLRHAGTGDKWAVAGSREGLFVPDGIESAETLLITEGPTDTAAALTIGMAAVGRPSCSGGARQAIDLIRRLRPAMVVIVPDGDGPGRRGADVLSAVLLPYVAGGLRVVQPPDGTKDLRSWVRAGATAADVQTAIEGAPVRMMRHGRKAVAL